MLMRKKLKKLYPIFALAFLFYMCAGAGKDYSDWYNENPEEDLLGSMFGEDAGQDEQFVDENQFVPDDNSSQDVVEDQQAPVSQRDVEQPVFSDESQQTPATGMDYTRSGHIAEFRSEIIRESKIASQNKIELIVSNKVRIKTISDSRWRSFSSAFVSAEDNQDLTITYSSQRTDPNGSFRVVLQPADPYKFFSFVPFEATGFEPSNYSVPITAIDLKTVSFNMQTDEGAWHTYRYSYQTYDLRPTINSFVNMEIKENSRPVTIRIYGSESRYPIQDARVSIKGTPPSRLRLLSRYFKNMDLLNYALSVAPDYADNASTIYSSLGGAQFNLYYPFDYTLEISHPDYFYKSVPLNVKKDTDVVEVYLDRLYTTARVVQHSSQDMVHEIPTRR